VGWGFPSGARARRRDALAIELYQVPQQVTSPKTSLSHFQLQAWWRGTMVRRNLGPYQALRKIQAKQLSKQKGKKDKSGAKKKTR